MTLAFTVTRDFSQQDINGTPLQDVVIPPGQQVSHASSSYVLTCCWNNPGLTNLLNISIETPAGAGGREYSFMVGINEANTNPSIVNFRISEWNPVGSGFGTVTRWEAQAVSLNATVVPVPGALPLLLSALGLLGWIRGRR